MSPEQEEIRRVRWRDLIGFAFGILLPIPSTVAHALGIEPAWILAPYLLLAVLPGSGPRGQRRAFFRLVLPLPASEGKEGAAS